MHPRLLHQCTYHKHKCLVEQSKNSIQKLSGVFVVKFYRRHPQVKEYELFGTELL